MMTGDTVSAPRDDFRHCDVKGASGTLRFAVKSAQPYHLLSSFPWPVCL